MSDDGSLVRSPGFTRRSACADAVGLLTTVALVLLWQWNAWDAHLRRPLRYDSDSLAYASLAKTIAETGWFQRSDRLGAPYGLRWYDFPLGGDNGNFVIMRLVSAFTNDWVVVVNVFFLASFFTTALTAWWALRMLGAARAPSIAGAIAYTCAPFHYARLDHLTLAHYAVLPVAVVLAMRAADGRALWSSTDGKWVRLGWAGAAVAVGSFNAYWAVFAMLTIVAAGLIASASRRTAAPALAALALTGVVAAAALINQAASVAYWIRHGTNPVAAARAPIETDFYALRTVQMLAPIPGGRLEIGWLSERLSEGYSSENTQHLGWVGAFLLFALLCWSLVSIASSRRDPVSVRSTAAALVVLWIAVASTGGLNWLLSIAGLAQIRAWNRVSILILFLVLVWATTFAPPAAAKLATIIKGSTSTSLLGICVLLAAIAVIDQTSGDAMPDPGESAERFRSDQTFFRAVERSLPDDLMVAVLPIRRFPESPPSERSADYDLLRPFLSTSDLRWSYGGMKGREAEWQQGLIGLSGMELLNAVTSMGFGGVMIDRWGYSDEAADLERSLASAARTTQIVSPDGRFSFFDLTDVTPRDAATIERVRRDLLSTPRLIAEDWWEWEGPPGAQQLWLGRSGHIKLFTPEPIQDAVARVSVAAPYGDVTLRIDADARMQIISVGPEPTIIEIHNNGRERRRVAYAIDAPDSIDDQRVIVLQMVADDQST